KRCAAAKIFQRIRLEQIEKQWLSSRMQRIGFEVDSDALLSAISASRESLEKSDNVADLLLEEAKLTKTLYRLASRAVKYGEFTRSKRGSGIDAANRLLDHGNYLSYGLAATAAWV